MEFAQFRELCVREWKGKEGFGDVVELSLTGPSAAELAASVASDPSFQPPRILRIREEDVEAIKSDAEGTAVGLLAALLVNPVTRSDVRITADAESDTATVSYGEHMPQRTVPVG